MGELRIIGIFIMAVVFFGTLSGTVTGQIMRLNIDPPFRIKNILCLASDGGGCEYWSVGGLGNLVVLSKEQRVSRTISKNDLNAIFAIGPRRFVVVGNNGEILVSTDSGRTWKRRISAIDSNLNGVHCRSEVRCAIVGDNGYILLGSPEGQWEVRSIFERVDLFDVQFLTDSIGYAVGDRGLLVRTLDAGRSWTQVQIPFSAQHAKSSVELPTLETIFFRDPKNGCVAGGVFGSGVVACTANGGETWRISSFEGHFVGIIWTRSKGIILVDKYGNNYHSENQGIAWKKLKD